MVVETGGLVPATSDGKSVCVGLFAACSSSQRTSWLSVLALSRSRARCEGVLRVSIQGQPAGTAARTAAAPAVAADAGALAAAVTGATARAANAGMATARRRRRDGSGISPPEVMAKRVNVGARR